MSPITPRSSEKGTKRGDWLTKHGLGNDCTCLGWAIRSWSIDPPLISDSPELLQRITAIVEGLPPLPQIDWDTHSGSYLSDFHSPLRIASGKPYRSRPQPSYGMRAGALPMAAVQERRLSGAQQLPCHFSNTGIRDLFSAAFLGPISQVAC